MTLTRIKALLALSTVFFCFQTLLAQSDLWTQIHNANSGLPNDTINWMTKSPTGDLWLSTNGGLAKYTGSAWTVFNKSNSNITSNSPGKSHVDSHGTVWFLGNGISKYNGTTFTNYNSGNSTLPNYNFTDFDLDSTGNVWMLTDTMGLVKFDGVNTTLFNKGNSVLTTNTLNGIAIEGGNAVWVSSLTAGLFSYTGTTWKNYLTSNSSIPTNAINCLTVIGTKKWFFSSVVGPALVSFDNTNWVSIPLRSTELYTPYYFAKDDRGDLWLMGWSGDNRNSIIRYDGTRFKNFSPTLPVFATKAVALIGNTLYVTSNHIGIFSLNMTQTYCAPGSSVAYLNCNNVSAAMDNEGGLWNGNTAAKINDGAGYEFPKGSSIYSIFGGGIWIAGMSDKGVLKGAVNMYHQVNDFYPGPLDHFPVNDTLFCNGGFDRIWQINKTTIDSFKSGLFTTIPQTILEWPAKGNPNLNFLPNRDLAPFADVNKDYKYNPADGDYPLVKGDQALWWMVNDANVHESNFNPIGIELQYMAYAFKTTSGLNNATFYEVKMNNRSDSILKHVNLTVFIDPDLGNYKDDFIGTDSTRNMGICYNSNPFDSTLANVNGVVSNGYGNHIPMVGVNMLQGPKDEFREPVKIKNLFSFNNLQNDWSGNPMIASDYWEYMNTKWRDSTHLVYGHNGHVSGGGTKPCSYIYPSDPSDASGWSECTAGSAHSDRRMIITYGEFNLVPNQTNCFTFSAISVPNVGGGCPSFAPIQVSADSVKKHFDTTLCKGFGIQITSQANSMCGLHTGSANVFASGGSQPYFYKWTNGSTTPIADSLPSGQYVITVTDVNECSSFLTVNISDGNGPTLVPSVVNAHCKGSANGQASVSVSGGTAPYTYSWSNNSKTATASGLPAGPVDFNVTDKNGCSANTTFIISEPSALSILPVVTASTCSQQTGSIVLTPGGGTPGYIYSWSNNATTKDLNAIPAGVYKLVLTDANACRDSLSVPVNDASGPVVTLAGSTPASCASHQPGTISVNISGGTPGYKYSWSNGATVKNLTGIAAGEYRLTVTDTNHCVAGFVSKVLSTPPSGNSVCMVSVDTSNNRNIIGWEKGSTLGIDHFTIYRESSAPNIYYPITTVPAGALSEYEDSTADAGVKSWRYKLSVVDSCGNESVLSSPQKTIHLTQSKVTNGILCSWDHYEGFAFNKYYVYRQVGAGPWQLIDTIASNYTYYTDYTAPTSGQVTYNIEVLPPRPCNFTRSTINTSKSNIKRPPVIFITGMGLTEAEKQLRLYPNPANSQVTLVYSLSFHATRIGIYNSLGQQVMSEQIGESRTSGMQSKILNIEHLSPGVYIVCLQGDETNVFRRLVVSGGR